MKNYEKYADEIKEFEGDNFCNQFVIPRILKSENCSGESCDKCRMCQLLWLLEDYEEPEVNWSKVEIDTPILVRECEEQDWVKRYFAKYEGGKVYAWNSGCTSWTTHCMTAWNYAKLAESEEE